ncbi:Endonuclease/exonuclease/phosphatase [Artemisia annua]|uniref:Endonuclease/exonuclease/phosphatase n=1 Tax=Artemisia annua TaxID=35608 RepID=A0A2U1PPE6_ARTAN|nr:Endonuclease/exonuclease/phosphatase [Artemisia annua]
MAKSEFSEKVNPSSPVTFKKDAILSPKNTLGNIAKVELDVAVEDSLINNKSQSTNKVGNQNVNNGLVAVSSYNGSRDTCGSNVKNHSIEKINDPVDGPANLNRTQHHSNGPAGLCTTQENAPKDYILADHSNLDFGLNGEGPNTSDFKVDSKDNEVNSSLNASISDNEILADFIAKQKGKKFEEAWFSNGGLESNNVSAEVEETLKVGNSIGFDMEDASIHVRNIVEDLVTPSEESERKGTEFDPNTTYSFNKFIDDAELQEVIMGARNFTRINRKGTKLSKLDRFLISYEVLHAWPSIHCTALPRKFLDHCPILMESNFVDFDPVPFKFFNSWLNEDSINLLVQSSWDCKSGCNRPDVNLYRNLKALKANLKPWSKNLRQESVQESTLLTKHLEDLDLKAETSVLSESDCSLRFEEIFFWHAGVEEKKVSWVAWSKVVASVKSGGLGIGSLKAFNLSLLSKWVWRWHTEKDALWNHTLHSIHGSKGGDFLNYASIDIKGVWYDILKACHDVTSLNIPLSSFFTRSIVNGHLSSAWNWRRSIRDGREKEEMESLVCLIQGVELKSGPDGWSWALESSGNFSVKSLRVKLDEKILTLSHEKTRWHPLVPKKVNILVWRADKDSLATRCNLDKRCIDLHLILCPMCEEDVESLDHLMGRCSWSRSIWNFIFKWWGFFLSGDLDYKCVSNFVNRLSIEKKRMFSPFHLHCFEVVIFTSVWYIWRSRNDKVFRLKESNDCDIFKDVQSISFC